MLFGAGTGSDSALQEIDDVVLLRYAEPPPSVTIGAVTSAVVEQPPPVKLKVDCGCSSGEGFGWLGLLLLRRRRGGGERQPQRERVSHDLGGA